MHTSKRAREIAAQAERVGHIAIGGVHWDMDSPSLRGFEMTVHRGMADPRVRHQIKQGLREVCAGQSRVKYNVSEGDAVKAPASDDVWVPVRAISEWACLCGFAVREEENPRVEVVLRGGEDRAAAVQRFIERWRPGLAELISVEKSMIFHLISKIDVPEYGDVYR